MKRLLRRRRSSEPHSSSSGFTLFEVMAAMAIFLVGIVGVLSLLASALGMHKEAVDREVAAMAADEVIAMIRQDVPGLPKDPDTQKLLPIPDSPVPGRPGYVYRVEFDDPGGLGLDLAKARVMLEWQSRGQSRAAEFVSFVDLNPSFEDQVKRARTGVR